MEEKLDALKLKLIELTNEFVKGGNNSDTSEIGYKIICIRETLKTLSLGGEWKHYDPNGQQIDPTDVIQIPFAIDYKLLRILDDDYSTALSLKNDPHMSDNVIKSCNNRIAYIDELRKKLCTK